MPVASNLEHFFHIFIGYLYDFFWKCSIHVIFLYFLVRSLGFWLLSSCFVFCILDLCQIKTWLLPCSFPLIVSVLCFNGSLCVRNIYCDVFTFRDMDNGYRFVIHSLYHIEFDLCVTNLFRVFVMKGWSFFSTTVGVDFMIFFIIFIKLVDVYVHIMNHTWDETNLIMVYELFGILFNLIL